MFVYCYSYLSMTVDGSHRVGQCSAIMQPDQVRRTAQARCARRLAATLVTMCLFGVERLRKADVKIIAETRRMFPAVSGPFCISNIRIMSFHPPSSSQLRARVALSQSRPSVGAAVVGLTRHAICHHLLSSLLTALSS
jgi:hypothetical protein